MTASRRPDLTLDRGYPETFNGPAFELELACIPTFTPGSSLRAGTCLCKMSLATGFQCALSNGA